ncbi:MAG: L-aspartate oxidase [Alphaproteobacteria bacterium]
MSTEDFSHDIIILGGGAAGLGAALEMPHEARIAVFSKRRLDQGATNWAQGGIATVLGNSDSFESHIQDTIKAGAGLCDPEIVRHVVESGPKVIGKLESYGIRLTHEDGAGPLHLNREAGHSHRRIVHAADATGRAVQACLEDQLSARGNADIFEDHMAIDLVVRPDGPGGGRRCVGVYALDRNRGRIDLFRARVVVLATGGASKAYLYTSNPPGATGDGIAMAWRAGCRIANMEFTQFHPTCLYHPKAGSFLITEAVRGEGGRLLLPDGSRFMDRFDPQAELAPRDIVARAIDYEMKRHGIDNVYLDISHKPADFIRSHFPTIHRRCLELGLDITTEPLPVVPAAHYTCGGIITDKRARTDIEGLYAIGECAFTGLHGANRLASNSLLECLVFAQAAGGDISATLDAIPTPDAPPAWDESWVREPDEEIVVSHNWDELRRFMWDYVGIVRTGKRLERAKHRIDLLMREIQDYYANFQVTADLLELRNLAVVADLIIRSAQKRSESRGLHYTLDHPGPDVTRPARNTVLTPDPPRMSGATIEPQDRRPGPFTVISS